MSGPAWDRVDEDDDALRVLLRPEESEAASRKKVLLRLLAREAAARAGLLPDAAQLAASEQALRQRFGLATDAEFAAWLGSSGLDRPGFDRLLHDLTLVDRMEKLLAEEIDALLPEQRRARSIATWRDRPRWLQFDLALAERPDGKASAAVAVFAGILPRLDPLTRAPAIQGFFLTRKPPGLRLRLAADEPAAVATAWTPILDALVADGSLAGWAAVAYEPELFRYGGAEGCRLVHAWFEADSLAWLRLEAPARRGELRPSREMISLAVLNDLLLGVLADRAEAWDVWCRLATMHGLPLEAPAPKAPVVEIDAALPLADAPGRAILLAYREANRAFAAGLGRLLARGALQVGARQLLTTLALFHWNRYGLTVTDRARLIVPMLRALDPNLP